MVNHVTSEHVYICIYLHIEYIYIYMFFHLIDPLLKWSANQKNTCHVWYQI